MTLQDTQGAVRAGDLQGQLQELTCSAARWGWMQGSESDRPAQPSESEAGSGQDGLPHQRGGGNRGEKKNYFN